MITNAIIETARKNPVGHDQFDAVLVACKQKEERLLRELETASTRAEITALRTQANTLGQVVDEAKRIFEAARRDLYEC
jgi:hypothetical protein